MVPAECAKFPRGEGIGPDTMSCAIRLGDGACIEILPRVGPGGVSARDRALLQRHEDGHCNQKTPSHEGYR